MTDEPYNTDYIAIRFLIGMCSLISIITLACVAWEIRTGAARLKYKIIYRSIDPDGFWSTVIVHCVIAAVMAGCALYMLKDAKAPAGRS